MRMRALTCLTLCAGFAVGLAVWLTPRVAKASVEDKHCCNPAHRETPPAPPGSAGDCTWDTVNNKCKSSQNQCTGGAYQTRVPGKCCTPLVDGNTCNTNNGTTPVTVNHGEWGCTGATANDCKCAWTVSGLVTDRQDVTQCSGSTCASNPTCN